MKPLKQKGILQNCLREFDAVEAKVDKMEHSIGSILSKIEHVLEKLSLVEVSNGLPSHLQVSRDDSDGEAAGNAAFMHDMENVRITFIS